MLSQIEIENRLMLMEQRVRNFETLRSAIVALSEPVNPTPNTIWISPGGINTWNGTSWDNIAGAGWSVSTSLEFTSATYNGISWSAGSIYLPNGSSYAIAPWSLSAISWVTYIYFDSAVSLTALQTTTIASLSVWATKALICVVKETTVGKLAQFQAFGTNSQSVFITADNIAANTITANEIAANTITASQISFNYAWSSSKWWNANDTNYVNSVAASTISWWASKANAAINASNRYKNWLNSNDISEWTSLTNGVILDSNWLRAYKSSVITFNIDSSWSAYFTGSITASSISWGTISWTTIYGWTFYTAASWVQSWIEIYQSSGQWYIDFIDWFEWPKASLFSSGDNYAWTGKFTIDVSNAYYWLEILWKMKIPVWSNLY